MKTLRISIFFICLYSGIACTQTTSVKPADSQVIGHWTLILITNGFSQKTQTPAEAGFTETLDYKTDGTYQRVTIDKNGQREEKGNFYTGTNPTKTAETQAILYPDDKTTQPYSFRDGHLLLYQRGGQDATLADGSTYTYQKQ